MAKAGIDRLKEATAELARRQMEPLRCYRPTVQQEPIHRCGASEVVVRGGKRSGKTLAVVMEFASRVLGTCVKTVAGEELPLRYPAPDTDRPRLYWVIGMNTDHIGQTIYHRLFEPGLGCKFRIIFDKKSKEWRSYNEYDERDKPLFKESQLAPPLIPERMIEPGSWVWENKAANYFKSVRLINGATICAYPSTGDQPKQGDAVDGIWIDEDIATASFIKEWQDRLITSNGWLLWSVWPHLENFALAEIFERAEKYEEDDDPPLKVFSLKGSENPYNSPEGIKRGLERMSDDEDQAHRDEGDISGLMASQAMYDYAPGIHLVKPAHYEKPQSTYERLAELVHVNGRLPKEWTRYLAIDPSHSRTGAVIGVVPPPSEWFGDRLIIEAELVAKKKSAQEVAKMLLPLMAGYNFEAFIMDQNMGRQTALGRAHEGNNFAYYGRQFAAEGLVCRMTGSSFIRGCNEPALRQRHVRTLLDLAQDGVPRLMFVENKTYETQRELRKYRKKIVDTAEGRTVLDEPSNPRIFDLMAALEYLVAFVIGRFADNSAYQYPTAPVSVGSTSYHAAMKLIQQQQGSAYVHLGPGAAA